MRRAPALFALILLACSTFNEEPSSDGGPDGGPADSGPTEGGSTDGGPSKLVFVSIDTVAIPTKGTLYENANAICNAEAKAAGRSGAFVAWLSLLDKNAISLLPNGVRWATSGGDLVFASKGAVGASQLSHVIDRAADQTMVSKEVVVWTNTNDTGKVFSVSGGENCQNLSSANASLTARGGTPAKALDAGWTSSVDLSCGSSNSVVCFEL